MTRLAWAVVGVAAMIVAAFVSFAWLLLRTDRLVRTAVERLARLSCPRCGGAFGAELATRVRAEWRARAERALAEARANHLRVRIDPRWRFACGGCSAALVFDPAAPRAPIVGDTAVPSARPDRARRAGNE